MERENQGMANKVMKKYIAAVREILVKEVWCISGELCYFDDSLCPAYRDGICVLEETINAREERDRKED